MDKVKFVKIFILWVWVLFDLIFIGNKFFYIFMFVMFDVIGKDEVYMNFEKVKDIVV